MPIRFVDRSVRIGLVQSTLADSTASLAGTHTLPAGRTGTIATRLDDHTSQLAGAFIANPNRVGTVASTLGNATAALQGSSQSDFTAPTVPGGLTVAVLGDTSLQPSWGSSSDTGGSGLAGYKLERSADGATAWAQIYQNTAQTFIDTGLPAGTTQFYRVRSYDVAGNSSGYSTIASAKTTGVAAGGLYNPDYPRFGSYAIGGTQNASNASLAAIHVNVITYYPGWENSRGTLQSKITAVKALSTIGSKILPYTLSTDAPNSWGVAPQAHYEWYTKLTTNSWFVYQNGLTHTTKIQGSESGFSKPNYTTACPVVAGDTAFTWKARWDYKLFYTGGAFTDGNSNFTTTGAPAIDGRYEDNIFARERTNGDYNVDGVSEAVSSAANISLIQASHAANAAFWRSIAPANSSLLMCNTADWPNLYPGGLAGLALDQKYDGGVMEHIDDFINGVSGSTAAALFNAIHVTMNAYRGAKLGILQIQISSSTSYDVMRYWHCIAGLTGTYLYLHVANGYLAQELGTLVYDEKTFALGAAIDPPQWTPRYQAGANGTGIYRRDCANGIYLWAAPGATYSAVNLGGTFYRLVGTLDPATNNGASVTSVTLAAGTGLVLSSINPLSTSVVGGVFTIDSGLGGLARGRVRWGQVTANLSATKLRSLKGYRISIGTTSGGTQIAAALDTTLTTQKCPTEGAITGLTPGTTYHVFVQAYNSAGNIGGASGVFSFVASVYAPATRNYTGRHLTAAQSITSGDWIFDNDFTGTLTVTQSNVYINGNGHFLTHGSGSHGIVINSGLTNVWIDGVNFAHASGTGDNIRLSGNVTNCVFSNNAFILRSNAGIGTGENPLTMNGSRIYGNTCVNQYNVVAPDSGIAMVSYCNGFLAYGNTCTNVGNAQRSGMFGECGNCEVWGNTWSCSGTNMQSFFWSSFGTITSFIHDNTITIGGTADTVRAINLDGPNGSGAADAITHVLLHNTFQYAAGANASGPFIRVRNPVGPVSLGFLSFNMLNGGGNAAISFGSNQSTGGVPVPFGGYIYNCIATNYGSSKPMGFYGENAWDNTLYMWDCDMGGEGDSGGGGQSGNLVCNNCTWPNGVSRIPRSGGATWDSFNTTVGGTNPFTTHTSWFGFNPTTETPAVASTPVAVTGVP